jgi:transcriptional regulator with XRE-family HTH domain
MAAKKGNVALGAYLRRLRELRGMSRARVVQTIGTNASENQIMRIEAGEIDTRATMLMFFLKAVQGNVHHAAELVLNSNATEEDGRRLAEEWVQREEKNGTNGPMAFYVEVTKTQRSNGG